MPHPDIFDNVSVTCKANVYFDGRVVSHTVISSSGEKKTLGIIFRGEFHFNTEAPERMDITAGACRVKLSGETDFRAYSEGESFHVPGNSGFDIAVDEGNCQYICSFG